MVNIKGTEYRKKEDLKRFFYPKEWLNFYDVLNNNLKLQFHFNFLMQTGCRYYEASKVQIKDVDFERNKIKILHAKTRIGGLKKIKVTCTKCNNKIYLSKTLKFCHICGNEIKNINELMKIYTQKITKRRIDIRNVRISLQFANSIKRFIKEYNIQKTDTFNFPTIQHMNQTMKRILKQKNVLDWQDFSPQNIRKTHENYLLATGSNPLSIRMHIGHSLDVAAAHYISTNIFTSEEIGMIKIILGNLKL